VATAIIRLEKPSRKLKSERVSFMKISHLLMILVNQSNMDEVVFWLQLRLF